MLATALPPVLPAPVAAPAPSAAGSSGNGPESFARMLDAADARRQADVQANKSREPRPAQKSATEKQDGAAPAAASGSADTEAPQTDHEGEAVEGSTAAEDTAGEQALATEAAPVTDAAALLADLAALPHAPVTDATAHAAAAHTRAGLRNGATAADDDAPTKATARGAVNGADIAGAATRLVAAAGAGGAGGAGGATAGGTNAGQAREHFSQLLRQARAEAGTPAAAAEAGTSRLQASAAQAAEALPGAAADAVTPAAALLATSATPGLASAAAAAVPGHARLAATPGSPEFASQLGAQLTTFVREGVQHARLELHPLELGPVTVQIAIGGTQARVNLAAEHAATRQALEQAMPALAGSLREAGLTLSGGGVFEQPRQPQADVGANNAEGRGGQSGSHDGSNDGRSEGSGARIERGPAAPAGTALRRRGVVDLLA